METIGILSLLPPLLAIILAITTKQVLISLMAAVWVGATLVNGYNPILGLFSAFGDHIFPSLGNPDNASVVVMTVFCGSFSYLLETGGGANQRKKGRSGAYCIRRYRNLLLRFN